MSAKSTYLENRILNHFLRATASVAPADVFAALYTSNPGEGNTGNEAVGGSYARQDITFGNAATTGEIASTATITFSNMPAGTFTHFAIFDAVTAGNMLYYGALSSPVTVTAGSTITLASGQITVTEE